MSNKSVNTCQDLFVYGCTAKNLEYFIFAILISLLGVLIIKLSAFILVVYLIRKKNKHWNLIKTLVLIVLVNNLLGGMALFLPVISVCTPYMSQQKLTCILEFCSFYFVGFNFSILSLVIAVSKFLMIRLNLTTNMIRYKYQLILASCFMLMCSFILSGAPILFNWNKYDGCSCGFTQSIQANYVYLNNSIVFALALTTTVIYLAIFYHVKKKHSQIFANEKNNNSLSKSKLKALKLNTLGFVVFFACWLPILVLTVYDMSRKNAAEQFDAIVSIRNYSICPVVVCLILVPIICSYRIKFFKKILFNKTRKKISNLPPKSNTTRTILIN